MNQIKYFGPVNRAGVPQGYGRLLYPSEDTRREYVGNFLSGKRGGYGILQWKDGCVYAGEWANDIQNGWGKLRFSERDSFNRESYEGEWLDGKRSGKGTLIFRSSDRYEGEWKNDKYHGKGEFIWYGECSGIKYRYQYVGEWVEGRRNENVGSFKVTPLATGISKDVHVQNLESEFVQNLANHPFHSSLPSKRKVVPLQTETTFDATHLLKNFPAKESPQPVRSAKVTKKQEYDNPVFEGDFVQLFDDIPQGENIGLELFAPADQDEESSESSTFQPPSPSDQENSDPKIEFSPAIPPADTETNQFFQDLIDWADPSNWDQSFLAELL